MNNDLLKRRSVLMRYFLKANKMYNVRQDRSKLMQKNVSFEFNYLRERQSIK